MRYFLAIILPPVAVLLCGKPVQFVLNIFLTLFIVWEEVETQNYTICGLHGPVSCTKICIKESRLTLGSLSVASRPAS